MLANLDALVTALYVRLPSAPSLGPLAASSAAIRNQPSRGEDSNLSSIDSSGSNCCRRNTRRDSYESSGFG